MLDELPTLYFDDHLIGAPEQPSGISMPSALAVFRIR
jgi:hypothetical protein